MTTFVSSTASAGVSGPSRQLRWPSQLPPDHGRFAAASGLISYMRSFVDKRSYDPPRAIDLIFYCQLAFSRVSGSTCAHWSTGRYSSPHSACQRPSGSMTTIASFAEFASRTADRNASTPERSWLT